MFTEERFESGRRFCGFEHDCQIVWHIVLVKRLMILLEWIIVEYGSDFCFEIVLFVLRLGGSIEHGVYYRYTLEDGILPLVSMCSSLVGAMIGSM